MARERQQVFTLPEIVKRAGGEYRTVHEWVKRGLVTPSIKATTGTGHNALYSPRDAEVICALIEIRRRGVGMKQLAEVAKAFHEDGTAPCPCCSTQLLLSDLQPADQQEGEHRG